MIALTVTEVASELGRSEVWLIKNWRYLHEKEGMPPPLHPSGTLVWSAPAIYAWIDRDMPEALRPHAAAYRAAFHAARAPDPIAQSRAELDARFAGGKAS